MTREDTDLLWLELALTPEVKPRHMRPLWDAFGSIEEIFAADYLAIGSIEGMSPGAATGIASRSGKEAAEKEFERLEKRGVSPIPFDSPNYPPLLREISDPPIVLYGRGELADADAPTVAVVGSRHCSAYGTQAAHRLAGDLAAAGVTVASGMAYGIDQAAHNGALAVDGRTVAVLGSGFGNIYPSGSKALVERIEKSGALLTEFRHDVPPGKGTFPQRNRIVSGMSHATIVVEAAERSGALITARLTLEQGRELLAVPGPIYEPKSFGSNYLIKRGAKLIQRAEDVLEELPEIVRSHLKAPILEEKKPETGAGEAKVLELLSVDTPAHIDIIAARLGMSTSDLSLVLLDLEMKSLVKQLPGMEYIKAI